MPRFDKVFTLIEHGMTLDEVFGEVLAAKLKAAMDALYGRLQGLYSKLEESAKSAERQ